MERELLQSLCDEYVLGVLEGDELLQLQQLLKQNDAEALHVLALAEETAAELAFAVLDVAPPPSLEQRVIGLAGQPVALPKASEVLPDNVIQGAPFGQSAPFRATSPVAWLGWAAAAGLAVGVYYTNGQTQSTAADLADAQQRIATLEMTVEQQTQVLNIIGARDSQTIRLVDSAEQPLFAAYWSGNNGLVLVGENIPAPQPGRTMQLWVVPQDGNPISAGLFSPSQDGSVLLIASAVPNIGIAAALAISDEPTGGSPQPTTTPAWIGTVGG